MKLTSPSAGVRRKGSVVVAEEHGRYPILIQPEPDLIAPPRIRLPIRIPRGEVIKIQAKIRHPSRTGLRPLAEHVFAKGEPAFYVKRLDVYYRDVLISTYDMTSALSDDPIVTFKVRASHEGPIRVVFTSSEDKTYEATAMLRFTEG